MCVCAAGERQEDRHAVFVYLVYLLTSRVRPKDEKKKRVGGRRGWKTKSQRGQSVFPGAKDSEQTVVTVSQDRRPSPDGCSREVLNSSDMISPHFSDYVQLFFFPLLPRKKSVIAHGLEMFFFFFFVGGGHRSLCQRYVPLHDILQGLKFVL